MQRFLQGCGYVVHCAAERAAAETLALHNAYACLIVDLAIEIPQGTDGFEILPFLRERSPRTKVVVLTGNGTPGIERTALRQGADAFLSKPSRLPELARIVRGLVGAPELEPCS